MGQYKQEEKYVPLAYRDRRREPQKCHRTKLKIRKRKRG